MPGQIVRRDRTASKSLRQTSILEDFVGSDARPELLVDGNAHSRSRIPPNLMVASALPLEFETCGSQSRYDVTIIIGHERKVRQSLERGSSLIQLQQGGRLLLQ